MIFSLIFSEMYDLKDIIGDLYIFLLKLYLKYVRFGWLTCKLTKMRFAPLNSPKIDYMYV